MANLCWIRRDLRLHDHHALSASLKEGETTLAFVFDSYILDLLKDKHDKRVSFIYQSLQELEEELQKKGSSLIVRYGHPEIEIPKLAQELKVTNVFCNRDYEPYAKLRDETVKNRLSKLEIQFHQFKDSVFFEKEEVHTGSGETYKVFTPYKNKWFEVFENQDSQIPDHKCSLKNLRQFSNPKNILKHNWYKEIGFIETPPPYAGGTKNALKRLKNFQEILDDYKITRDFPAKEGTSGLSAYIRHGNLSVRDMMRAGMSHKSIGAKTWVSEIIWRDFYQTILDAFPHVAIGPFKPEYKKIKWRGKEEYFKAWCEGQTGFPIVDAAMRCMNQTGLMHNRLRMVVASFLCKTLLINWQEGEHYFADKLLDFDLASNNGGWQWSSSSGCDAQPYFRIFNPYNQSEKFDPDGSFIKQWIPELKDLSSKEIHRPDLPKGHPYPQPIVSYETSRVKCLEMYSVVKKG